LKEAEVLLERWQVHYNTRRPHSSLRYRPPAPEAIQPPNQLDKNLMNKTNLGSGTTTEGTSVSFLSDKLTLNQFRPLGERQMSEVAFAETVKSTSLQNELYLNVNTRSQSSSRHPIAEDNLVFRIEEIFAAKPQ
jgi:hypothetical protein